MPFMHGLIMYAKLVIFSYICKQKLIFVDI